MSRTVFVSYSHKQGDWVWDRLVSCLVAGGAEVLIDREQFKAARRLYKQADDVQEHLLLAQWCERNGLLNRAADELNVAAAMDPRHPLIGMLRRRLAVATEKPRPSVRTAASTTPAVQSPS